MKRFGVSAAGIRIGIKFNIVTAALLLPTLPAWAQSSVTLYGVVDNGIGYQSSQTTLGSTTGGRSAVKMLNGVWGGSRFGMKGSEDLGGGLKAVFQLEEGVNTATGAQATTGLAFNRLAFVGMSHPVYGTLTLGRQYTPYYNLLSPYGPSPKLTGYYGAHPGDLDSLDTVYRANNEIIYTTPTIAGLTFSGSYALGGVPGSFNAGSTWSTALQYAHGPFGIAAGYQRFNNSAVGGGAWGASSTASNAGAEPGVSAINLGYQTAQAQQRFAVTTAYAINSAWDISGSYSNVQYIAGNKSAFTNTAIFNTEGVVLHFKPGVAWDLAAGYSYTRATRANNINSEAQYHQVNFTEFYALSARTGIYFMQAWQRAHGQTLGAQGAGNIVTAAANIGDGWNSSPASSPSQVMLGIGINHKF
jgi:predicted porin